CKKVNSTTCSKGWVMEESKRVKKEDDGRYMIENLKGLSKN
ncbi:hypothetical protein A2U01_0015650, partial [Trifolium medium]|nr:hypothetical protein [Trifolium medium]